MEQELAYSFHLGSDKNKSKLAKKVAKDYDNQRDLIRIIYGTNDIVNDVKQVYLDELKKQD